MAQLARVPEPVPFSTINVTPFIDVLLVLLVVLMMSLPLSTHKVPIELPQGPGHPPSEVSHLLAIDRTGGLSWDGAALSEADLPARLAPLRSDATAVLHMSTDPEARYERFDQVLAVVKRAGIERLGFVGNRPLED